jgi:DNA-binding transcriptional LysR family regulator
MLHARILTYLDEVARSGSIRKAAARLNVASTAINRQIIALEEEMGQRLFDRIPRRLRLTAAGEVLIEHVRDTLKAFERTKARLDALKEPGRDKSCSRRRSALPGDQCRRSSTTSAASTRT